MEARVGIEPTIAELQSTALPLCYRAIVLLYSASSTDVQDAAILGNVGNKSTIYQLRHSIAAKPV
jgi:hypothetical protein